MKKEFEQLQRKVDQAVAEVLNLLALRGLLRRSELTHDEAEQAIHLLCGEKIIKRLPGGDFSLRADLVGKSADELFSVFQGHLRRSRSRVMSHFYRVAKDLGLK